MLLVLILLGKQHGVVITEFFFVEDGKNFFPAVSVRLADSGVQPGIDKAVDHTVVSISTGEVAEESLHNACLNHKGG